MSTWWIYELLSTDQTCIPSIALTLALAVIGVLVSLDRSSQP